ncbi:MAG: hypothetical protein LAT75_00200 [Candidatus Cyclonatronum sp.]|uniref:hypothetical protein n=1 Tax=Cyclonatronum sp. TaxID=3024185 RepID=UPI0025C081D6|nr:hypothetical protein [Cyclonatronum sp.]MCH8485252.1 hypothetical protein [Cyclonatronum sp.]
MNILNRELPKYHILDYYASPPDLTGTNRKTSVFGYSLSTIYGLWFWAAWTGVKFTVTGAAEAVLSSYS